MSDFVIRAGEKIHVITRRIFLEDVRRHFAGVVTVALGGLVRAEGHVFVFNTAAREYRRRTELRTRIFSLGDAGHIVNVLPPGTRLESLRYVTIDQRLMLTDGANLRLDVNEFSASV